ncbi:DNA-binding protein [Virgibacillus sp. Bac330]|uniref:DNA-binding protein n=1 Tax=Virgibacillus sp. Bac330 TaxID=2419841 RepID=UPI000EF51B81|nr:DNA-binding protein [Virgibacillus sp. Bac330]
MQITPLDLEARLLEEELKILFQQAYEKGIQDAEQKYNLPHHLRKPDVAEIFQVSLATVENIIRMEGFPKSKVVSARYPRDMVLKWAEDPTNIERVNRLRNKLNTEWGR